MNSLFDSSDRTDPSPAYDTESSYHFLNRVARPQWELVRRLVEEWFADYPASAQPDLRSRFQSDDYAQHMGAWWELYVHRLFRRLECEVSIHPALANTSRQPDFLVTRGDASMYVECVIFLSTLGPVDGNSDGERSWIFEATNQANSPNFMVDIAFRRSGTLRPRASEIVRPLERWLSSLDPDEVSAQSAAGMGLPSLVLDVRGWVIEYGAWPVAPEHRGEEGRLIGFYPMVGGFTNNEMVRHREIIKRKGGHYGLPDKPLVVAVLNTSGFLDESEVAESLFGTKAVDYYQYQPTSIELVRKRDGYWRQGPPKRGSRVSALIDGENIYPWSIVKQGLPKLWLNPWADKPLTHTLPLKTFTAHDTGEVHQLHDSSMSPEELFEVPREWPGFAQ